jgi:hypothetical protein
VTTALKNSLPLLLSTVPACLWFALWLIGFQPAETGSVESKSEPPKISIVPDTSLLLDPLRSPSLFALPSENGFSGVFPETLISSPVSATRTEQPLSFLPRPNTSRSTFTPDRIGTRIPLAQETLPVPRIYPSPTPRDDKATQLFFSSETLKTRLINAEVFESIISSETEISAQAHLFIGKDGWVQHAFFDTPTDRANLLQTIRLLRFHPADSDTDGWLTIRVTPKQGGNAP